VTKGLLAHFYGGLAARRLGIPCIWYIQEEVDEKRAGGFFRLLLRWYALRLPNSIIVDADALLEQFNGLGLMAEQIFTVYNGIDTNQFVPANEIVRQVARVALGLPDQAIVIGQTGRLIPLKGQLTLLDAFISLTAEFPDIHLLFVGAPLFGSEDYEKELRHRAAQADLEGRVHFSGFLPDVREGLSAMDIYVHASVETDSPVGVLEAMACGLPVLVSAVRGTIDLVIPEEDAVVFVPGDVISLALSLSKLLKDPNLRVKIGKQARVSVTNKFSLRTSVFQVEELIEKIYET
jgi:glycosyltransferase involved in cell wall biosynthesis